MQFSVIVIRFIVKTYLNSAFTNDLKRKEKFSKNAHSCRLNLFKIYEIGKMYTWILVFTVFLKIETLVLKLKDQKLQTMQL